jgi:hypothetical protein
MMVVMFLGRFLRGSRNGQQRKRSGTQQDRFELHDFSPRNAIEIAAMDAASSPRTLEKLRRWYWWGTSDTRSFHDGFITRHRVLPCCIDTSRRYCLLCRSG